VSAKPDIIDRWRNEGVRSSI